jgi:hypothetical protein
VLPRFSIWLFFGALAALIWALLGRWEPLGEPWASVCLSRRVFSLPCPSCGFTRAVACLAKGEWTAALALHPMAPAVVAEGLALWLAWGLALRRVGPRHVTWLGVVAAANYAALVALWLGRAATGTLPW